MSTFKEKCNLYYGTTDFYEVLGISCTATDKDIKKAYHRLSLLVHPDRVETNQKEVATEKFKVLGRIHSILQDNDKRKIYDECGDFDEETEGKFNWTEYWFATFKKIELKDIQEYEKQYIGSETEKNDIKKAYEKSKGNMNRILELVPFSSCDSESRIIGIVRTMVDNDEVPEYASFFNESKIKKMRRRRKWEAEAKEASKVDWDTLQKEVEENNKKRALAFADMFANIEAKYATKKARKSITGPSPQGKKVRRKNLKLKGRRSRVSPKYKYSKRKSRFLDYVPFIASLFQ